MRNLFSSSPSSGCPEDLDPPSGIDEDNGIRESYPLKSLQDGLQKHEILDQAQSNSPLAPTYDDDENTIHDESQGLLLSGQLPQSTPSSGRTDSNQSTFGLIVRWIQGPRQPRPLTIEPIFRSLQTLPLRLLNNHVSTRNRRIMFICFHCCWIVAFVLLLRQSVTGADMPNFGPAARLDCTSRIWTNATNCGLDGDRCRPFETSNFAFVCPAGCGNVQVLEPYYVGPEKINYQSLVIGGLMENTGNAIYRGDSFICAAAIHAGVVSHHSGGCGLLSRKGEQSRYPSGKAHGIRSISFPSYFPLSFAFRDTAESTLASCADLRWTLLAVSVLFTSILSTFTASPAIFFASTFIGIFFHVALASDPPYYLDYTNVISVAFRRLLPASFVAFVLYMYCIRRTLCNLNAQLEKTIFWLGGCWVGALNNYTLDKIPISRLTPHDLKQQPGAILALVIIVAIIFIVAIIQAWCFRLEGRMPRYLAFYAVVGTVLLLLAGAPGMNLRIHHYILALIFLPGTSLQTRPSLLFQGLLVGLFINGIARWGFDSILQTPGQLLGDAELGSPRPQIDPPIIISHNHNNNNNNNTNATITFTLNNNNNFAREFDGISVLVNDVERFRTTGLPDASSSLQNFTWSRHVDGLPEYFRFGYVKSGGALGGGFWYGDFTEPAIWEANGSWIPP